MNVSGSLASGGLVSRNDRDTAPSGYATSSDLDSLTDRLSEYATLSANNTFTGTNTFKGSYVGVTNLFAASVYPDHVQVWDDEQNNLLMVRGDKYTPFEGEQRRAGTSVRAGFRVHSKNVEPASAKADFLFQVKEQRILCKKEFQVDTWMNDGSLTQCYINKDNTGDLILRGKSATYNCNDHTMKVNNKDMLSITDTGTTVNDSFRVNGNVTGVQLKATSYLTTTVRQNVGGSGASYDSIGEGTYTPVLHVMHDPNRQIGRWVARATDGTWGWLTGLGLGGTATPSDDRLKYNKVSVRGAIEYVKALQPRHYTKKRSLLDADEGGIEEYGFIAQHVESIEGLECLVSEDFDCRDENLRVKHMNYNGVTTISVQALKELITRVEDLETRLAVLETS